MIDEKQLLASLGPKLRRRAADMLGTQSRYTDDLAQEGWVAVWRALPTVPAHLLNDADALEGWCIGVARNKMRNWIRDELAAPRRGLNNELSAGSGTISGDALFEALSSSEALDGVDLGYHDGKVAAALEKLTPTQRRYVFLRFWGDQTKAEICEQLGYSESSGSFSTAWALAKANLVRELSDEKPAPRMSNAEYCRRYREKKRAARAMV